MALTYTRRSSTYEFRDEFGNRIEVLMTRPQVRDAFTDVSFRLNGMELDAKSSHRQKWGRLVALGMWMSLIHTRQVIIFQEGHCSIIQPNPHKHWNVWAHVGGHDPVFVGQGTFRKDVSRMAEKINDLFSRKWLSSDDLVALTQKLSEKWS